MTKLSGDRLEKRLEKCRETVRAACEQCGRNRLPEVVALSLKEAFALEGDLKLILAPGAQRGMQTEKPRSVLFAVGPEGGFAPEELQAAEEAGWRPTLLGPRVLRTETAGLAAAAWINALYGDFAL